MFVKCISTTSLINPPGPQEAHHQCPDVLQAVDIQVTGTEEEDGGGLTILVSCSEALHFHPSHREACQKP